MCATNGGATHRRLDNPDTRTCLPGRLPLQIPLGFGSFRLCAKHHGLSNIFAVSSESHVLQIDWTNIECVNYLGITIHIRLNNLTVFTK